MTKEQILSGIKKCAQKLGHAPSYTELQRTIQVTRRAVIKHFGTYTAAVRECGLERRGSGHPVAMDALFQDWAGVARKLGKLPTVAQYERHGKFSIQPLFTRFGNWRQTPVGMMLYAQEHGMEEQWRDVIDMVKGGAVKGPGTAGKKFIVENGKAGMQTWKPGQAKIMKDRPTYGRPMVDGPLANEPDCEQAVVFLFGAKARELGFVAVKVRTGYPDCEAWREVAPGVWQMVKGEIELYSRNFLSHKHDLKKIDLIICWKHNWKECPVEVVELGGIG
jgi:hypothetical protein